MTLPAGFKILAPNYLNLLLYFFTISAMGFVKEKAQLIAVLIMSLRVIHSDSLTGYLLPVEQYVGRIKCLLVIYCGPDMLICFVPYAEVPDAALSKQGEYGRKGL